MANKRRLTIEIVGDEKNALKAFDRTEKGASGLTGKLKKIGVGLAKVGAAAGVAVGAAVAKGLSDAMNIEAANDRLAAQLGLSEEMAEKAGDMAGRLYGNAYGESFEQVSGAVGAVIAGLGDLLPEDKIEDTTAKVLDLASAFEVDVNDAVSSTSVLISSGLARDADHALDLITSGMQEVPAAMRGEVFPVLEEYAQSFGALGISGEDAMGLLAQASQGGRIELDKVGDALKELTIRSSDMSSAAVEAFQAAGLNADDMAARFLEGGDSARGALDDLVDGLLAMEDPVERSNAAIALFGTPLEDLGTSEIPEFLNGLDSMWSSMGDVEGAAESMGDTLNNNLKTKLESVRRKAMMKLAEVVGNVLIPAFERLDKIIRQKIKDWRPAFEQIARVFGDVADRVGRFVGDVVAAFRGGDQEVGGTARSIAETLRRLWEAIQLRMEAIRATIDVVLTVVQAAWDRFGRHIVAFARGAFDAIMQIVRGALDVIDGVIKVFVGIITLDFSKAWEGIKQIFSGAWQIIVGLVKSAINTVKTTIAITMGVISQIWSGAWEGVKRSFSVVWSGITTAASNAIGGIKDRIGGIVDFVRGLPDRIRRAATGMFDGISQAFSSAINVVRSIWNTFRRAWNAVEVEIPKVHIPGTNVDIGGGVFGLPDLPVLHSGGVFRAPPGETEGLAVLRDRERVVTPEDDRRRGDDGVRVTVQFNGPVIGGDDASMTALARLLSRHVREEIRRLEVAGS